MGKILTYFFGLSLSLVSLNVQAVETVPGEYIVKYKSQRSGVAALGKTSLRYNMKLKQSWTGLNIHHFKLQSGGDESLTLSELRSDPDIAYVEPNYYVKAQDLPYPMTNSAIRAPESWDSGSSSASVPVIAILDSGLDVNHSVFSGTGRLWQNQAEASGSPGIDDDGNGYVDDINGWNFIDSNDDLSDSSGHGTHVAGISLGATEDIFDIQGDAVANIMVLKFLDQDGIGKTSDAIAAIYYAVDNGAKILNNSWGGGEYSVALHEAINYSFTNNTIFVAAAGNSGTDNDQAPIYPANYDVPNVVSVGASTDSDFFASFSNRGKFTVDLAAPGVNILSTIPGGGFGLSTGTSMASPFIAGLAALVSREAPHFTGYQIKETILNSVDDIAEHSEFSATSGRAAFESAVLKAIADKGNPSFSPEYTPVYELGSRELASSEESSGGFGCGRVKDVYKNQMGQGKGESPLSKGMAMILILLPMVVIVLFRRAKNLDKRKEERKKVSYYASLETANGAEHIVHVHSLSSSGAGVSLSGLDEALLNGYVKLRLNTNAAKSNIYKVVRVHGDQLGLQLTDS